MERATRGKGRGGRGKQPAQAPQIPVTNRTINWSLHETVHLLSATREVQLKAHRIDIKFSPTEWQQVHHVFQASGDFSHRSLDMAQNRLKVVRSEYSMVKELLGRSGWSWDSGRHMVVAPDADSWNDICKQGPKWKSFPGKTFPWYEQFCQIIGNSATTGELGQTSVIQTHSGTGSSDGARDYDDVPLDSEERARFNFEQINAMMEEDSVQQPAPAEVRNPGGPSTETGGTSSARSRSSNKRKSTDTAEGSRSQRAKRSITNSQQNQENMLQEVRELVKTSGRLAKVGEEFVDLAKKKVEVPPHVMAELGALVLNGDDKSKAMRTLKEPIEQQIFMFGGQGHKINYLNKIIPGFMQRNIEAANQDTQYNPFFNQGYFGGPSM